MIKDYKGYSAKVFIDEEQGILHGEVLGIVDVVTFEGRNVEELVQAFHDSVDDYLAYCEERGEEPDKPYSGRFVLRMPPKLHRSVAVAAKKSDLSMNDWISAAIKHYLVEDISAAGTFWSKGTRSQDWLRLFAEEEAQRTFFSTRLLSQSLSELFRRKLVRESGSDKPFRALVKEFLSEEWIEEPY